MQLGQPKEQTHACASTKKTINENHVSVKRLRIYILMYMCLYLHICALFASRMSKDTYT